VPRRTGRPAGRPARYGESLIAWIPASRRRKSTPAGKTPVTGAGPCRGVSMYSRQSSRAQERCPVGALKEADGTP